MPKRYTSREVLRALKRAGFESVSQRRNHIKLKGIIDGRTHVVVVPNHPEIAVGTFRNILRQAGLQTAEFETYL